MPGKKIKMVEGVGCVSMTYALDEFMKHCKRRNLSAETVKYYAEDIGYFQKVMQLENTSEICKEILDSFVDHEMNKGNKITAINSRLRGLRVFFRYCAETGRSYPFKYPLLKEDEYLKEPYTKEELQLLLRKPTSDRWAEWRIWAVVNTFVATGIRANTLVNIQIKDLDFDHDSIFLKRLKNRRQQFVPMSSALKEVLMLYLKLWDWKNEDFLFPTSQNTRMGVHSLQSAVRHYNLRRNVSKTSMHLFRHTFAKNYILAGGQMAQLQVILGHSTLDMTRRYVNLYGNDIKKDFDRLNPLNNIDLGG